MPETDIQLVRYPLAYVALPATDGTGGAEAVFLGRTRDDRHETLGELRLLYYEAYESMAVQEMQNLATDAADRLRLSFVRVHHALGPVEIGEASVLIQVAAGHRGEAFEACRWLIDELKRSVPIWKREVWAEGETWSDQGVRSSSKSG